MGEVIVDLDQLAQLCRKLAYFAGYAKGCNPDLAAEVEHSSRQAFDLLAAVIPVERVDIDIDMLIGDDVPRLDVTVAETGDFWCEVT